MELEEIRRKIDVIFSTFGEHSGNPVKLLTGANQLLTQNYHISTLYIEKHQAAELMEVDYKRKTDRAFLNYRFNKLSVEESKAKAREDNADLEITLIKLQVTAKELAILRRDLSDKVSVIQSYCSHFKSQQIQDGLMHKA